MRLLHVHSGNLYGGVETLMVTLVREGYRCPPLQTEFALCYDGRLADELRVAGAKVFMLGEARTRNPLSLLASRRCLRQVLDEGSYDAVVTHMPWAQALLGGTARASGVPLVFWMHDAANGRHWLERWAARTQPDLVLCNSHYTASTLKLLYPDSRAEVVACPIAIEGSVIGAGGVAAIRRELHTPGDATVIIQTSRMEAWKGHELHLRALGILRDLGGWVLWLVGGAQRPVEQHYQAKLERMAIELGIAERVRFLGHRSDVPRLLKAADIYCQPNQGPEPFGIVFIEALAAGLPVVSVDFGGAREIVNQNCGALVAPGDVDALANVLRHLILEPHERRRLGQAGPARARKLCDPATQMNRIDSAIGVVAQRRSPTALSARSRAVLSAVAEAPKPSAAPVAPVKAPQVSVVIPAFNGALRLPRVLAALAAQDAPAGSFEIIVVDNASTDDTGLVTERDPSVARMASRAIICQTINEHRQGSSQARKSGLEAARGELICFLDDDNIPAPDYISCGIRAFADSTLALAVSKVFARWEVQPPPSVYRRRHLLAVNDYNGDQAITFTSLIAPTITAGMWVRRSAFLEAVGSRHPDHMLKGRAGDGLACGEDIEIGILFALAGYRRRYESSLRIWHEIPASRLSTQYFKRLIFAIVRSELTLREKYVGAFGVRERGVAWVRLFLAACAIPVLRLYKTDGKREAAFILADRYARVKGPFDGDL